MLEEVWQEYRDRGVVVLDVNAQDFASDARVRRALRHDVPGRPRRARLLARTLRPDRVPGDMVDRPAGPARRLPGTTSSARTSSGASSERSPRREVRGRPHCRVRARRSGARRRPADPRRPRGRARLSTCDTSLEMSSSPIAERMRVFIRERIAAGDSKEEIKAALVEQFGEGVLAAEEGFNLLAWLLPLVGLVLAGAVVAVLARRWLAARTDGSPTSRRRASTRHRAPARATELRALRRLTRGGQDRARVRGGASVLRDALRAAARPRLPRGRLGRRTRRGRAAGRGGEPSVRRRVHRRVRRARRGRGRDRGARGRQPPPAHAGRGDPRRLPRLRLPGAPAAAVVDQLAAGSSRARGGADRRRSSARRSPSAPPRASARCSPRSSRSRAMRPRSRRGPSCCSSTRSGSRCRSSSSGSASPGRWARSAGCATTTASSGSSAAPFSSRSDCSSSSTAGGG